MKKICRFLPLLTVACASPALTLLSSCAPIYSESFREIDFSKDTINNLNDTKKANANFEKLLLGDKSYHNGNYIIVFGAEVSKESNKYFCSGYYQENESNDYFDTNLNVLAGSAFASDYASAKAIHDDFDFGLNLYIDHETQEVANQLKDYWKDGKVSFLQNWSSEQKEEAQKAKDNRKIDVDQKYNSNKEMYEAMIRQDYVRQDEEAIKYRELITYIQTLYTKDVFKLQTTAEMPYAMVWLKGVPQKDKFVSLKTSEEATLTKLAEYLRDNQETDKDK